MVESFVRWIPSRHDFRCVPTEGLAAMILGCLLVSESLGSRTTGIVVEAEAYLGIADRACHAFGGRKTPRLRALWSGPGLAYTYAMHQQWLLNITAQQEGIPECVLVRALWPLDGLGVMASRRGVAWDDQARLLPARLGTLTSGPGRLCKALCIDKAQYGWDLLDPGSLLRLEVATDEQLAEAGIREGTRICSGPRVGVAAAGPDALRPLRFWFEGNPLVSRH
jgi:DNA-3-methyladenine glycosylase